MEGCYLFAKERDLLGAQRIHEIAVVYRTCEESQGETCTTEDGVAGHQHNIHLSVLYACFGCNQRRITPLVRVGEGNEKGFMRHIQAVAYEVVGLRLVGEHLFDHVLHISHKPVESVCLGFSLWT